MSEVFDWIGRGKNSTGDTVVLVRKGGKFFKVNPLESEYEKKITPEGEKVTEITYGPDGNVVEEHYITTVDGTTKETKRKWKPYQEAEAELDKLERTGEFEEEKTITEKRGDYGP